MNKTKILIITGAMLVTALVLILYPLIANAYYERHKAEIRTEYQEQVSQLEESKLTEARESAIAYNEMLRPVLETADRYSTTALESAANNYGELLDVTETGIMGYVDIPKINVNLPIYHGTASETLEKGIGHLLGSSLPVGGVGTHAILTAHSGMASQKMFSDLERMETGDVFYLHVLDETLAYQVDAINTVLPYETELLSIPASEDYCTLITCTPFGVNTHRLLVRGSRIPIDSAEINLPDTQQSVESTWMQHYIKGILFGITVVIVLASVVGVYLWQKRRR